MLNLKDTVYCYYSEEQERVAGVVYYEFKGRIIRLTEIRSDENHSFLDAKLIAKGLLEDFIFIRRESNQKIYPW